MRPSVGTPNAELLPPAFLFPLLVFLVLSNATVADVQNDSTEPSWTTVLTPSASPIVESWRQELKPRRPIETPPTEYLPYPAPSNYNWAASGMTPQDENPQPSEFDPPTGWNTGQSGSNSGSPGAYQSAASLPLRPNLLFRLIASVLGTHARPVPQIHPQSLPSAHLPKQGHWPPGAIPSVSDSPTTTEFIPSLLAALFPRSPVETPPTQFLPYPPPPGYVWPAGQGPQSQNPQPSEQYPQGGSYGGFSGQGGGSGVYTTQGPGVLPASGGAKMSSQSDDHKGLSAKVMIAIVIPLVAVALIVAWWVWRTQKIKKRKKEEAEGPEGPQMVENED